MMGSKMEFALDLNLIYNLVQDGSLFALTKLKEHFIHCCGAYEWCIMKDSAANGLDVPSAWPGVVLGCEAQQKDPYFWWILSMWLGILCRAP